MCITPLHTKVTSDSVHDLVDLAPFTKSSFNNYVDIGQEKVHFWSHYENKLSKNIRPTDT